MIKLLAVRGCVVLALLIYIVGVSVGGLAAGLISNGDGSAGAAAQDVFEVRFVAEIKHALRNESNEVVSYLAERLPSDGWPFRGVYEVSQYRRNVAAFDRFGYPMMFSELAVGDVVEIAYDSDCLILDKSPMAFEKGVRSIRVIGDQNDPSNAASMQQPGQQPGFSDGAQQPGSAGGAELYSMRVRAGSATPTGATLVYENNTYAQAKFSSAYSIQLWNGDGWTDLSISLAFHTLEAATYYIDGGETKEETLDWSKELGELSSGRYRLVKHIADVNLPHDMPFDKTMIAEFVIA